MLFVWKEKGTKMFHKVDRVATLTIFNLYSVFYLYDEIGNTCRILVIFDG